MDRADATRLTRVLAGQRLRFGAGQWIVLDSAVAKNRLRIDLRGAVDVSFELELPEAFDCRSGDDMAWLLGQIEARLDVGGSSS